MFVLRQSDDKSQLIRQLALFGVIPVLMAVGPLVGFAIGKLLDGWLGTEPFLMVLFIGLGFAASGKEVYDLIRKVSKDL
jgi:F0F1-type ATP synthase assembly protein I